MIAVDTSALCAILFSEPDSERYDNALFEADQAVVGAPTAFEFLMVAQGRRDGNFRYNAERLLAAPGLRIVGWEQGHVALASQAFARYGKGSGHPAQLNYGDCMSYALAKALDVPLLFKGEDFRRTDVRPAV